MMASARRTSFQQTNSQKTDINILLLGETGVGKSTFINSFVNYLQHTTLSNARKSQLVSLIPSRFTIPDEHFQDRIIEFGFDENEDIEIGNSSTQGTRGYVFRYDNRNIRLIDTPGIGDARGIDQDGINFENVLSYINQFEHLHAICFLLKPNVSVINAYFKFCIVHLLSRLEKSAANNIAFIFTNCRSTFYRPGDTLPVLKRILQEIQDSPPHVKIPCDQKNMFCVDNEAFKFLVALKQNVPFGEYELKEFSTSWERSYNTCKAFISYICGEGGRGAIVPHPVQNTISVNEARRNIINLSKPLADVCDVIQDNITVLKRHEQAIEQDNLSKTELVSKLYVPIIELNVITLPQPVTVCTTSKCSEIYTVEGMNKHHYKQRCHNPCYLTNVPKEIIGTPELRNCAAMCGASCTRCGCDFTAHMHIYYQTETAQARQEDKSVKRHIKTKEDAIAAKNIMVQQLKRVCEEYEYEKREISKCMAKFAHFLKENSISVYNDAYIDYLDYLIEREKLLGYRKDQERINHYMSLKKHYELEKKILDDTMKTLRKTDKNAMTISPQTVLNLVKDLYRLPHMGKKIKMLHTIQQKSVESTVKNTEYMHPTAMNSSTEHESSSSEDESVVGDFDILETLIKESSLEGMRLKLKDMKLSGDRKEVDERKQKIFNYLTKLCGKAEGESGSGEENVKKGKNSGRGGRGRGKGRQQQCNRDQDVHASKSEYKYTNSGQRQNNTKQRDHWNQSFNQQRPHFQTPQDNTTYNQQRTPLFQTPRFNNSFPHNPQFQNNDLYGAQYQNPNFYGTNPVFQNPGYYGTNPNIRPLLATSVNPPYQKPPINQMGPRPNNNRSAFNNQRGNRNRYNEHKFKKPNNRNKNRADDNNTSGDSSESEEDSKPEDSSKSFDLMKKLMEEKLKNKGKSDAGSVFMYYHKK